MDLTGDKAPPMPACPQACQAMPYNAEHYQNSQNTHSRTVHRALAKSTSALDEPTRQLTASNSAGLNLAYRLAEQLADAIAKATAR